MSPAKRRTGQRVTAAALPERFLKVGADLKALPIEANDWLAVYDTTTAFLWLRGFVLAEPKPWKPCIAVASKLKLLGLKGWSAPTLQQRVAIADYTRTSPAIDTRYFDSPSSGWEWTATPYASSPRESAWYVYFDGGHADCCHQSYGGFVRVCRASQDLGLLARGAR